MSLVLDLPPEQKAERRTGIGGSHAPRIMVGDWQSLWLEITGREQPKQIMSGWNYALRIATETLQLDWWEYKTGQTIIRRSYPHNCVRSTEYPWMRATLDGMIKETGEPVNAKHVSTWTGKQTKQSPRTWAVEFYVWQILHEIIVCSPPSMRGWISLIVGEKEPEPIAIDADPISLQRLIAAEEEFWGFVQRDEPPDSSYTPEASLIEWETMREVEMTGSNEWAYQAGVWCDTIGEWRRCGDWKRSEDAITGLKALVEKDVRSAWGHGVIITRNRAGSLTIK